MCIGCFAIWLAWCSHVMCCYSFWTFFASHTHKAMTTSVKHNKIHQNHTMLQTQKISQKAKSIKTAVKNIISPSPSTMLSGKVAMWKAIHFVSIVVTVLWKQHWVICWCLFVLDFRDNITFTWTQRHSSEYVSRFSSKMPDHFDQTVVLNQLRYSGMLETVKIRRTGFPVRRTIQDFCSRFVPTTLCNHT